MPLAPVGGSGALVSPSQLAFMKTRGHLDAGLLNACVLHLSFNKNTHCSDRANCSTQEGQVRQSKPECSLRGTALKVKLSVRHLLELPEIASFLTGGQVRYMCEYPSKLF